MAHGAWRMARGAWRVARGAWRVARGAWRVARGARGAAWRGAWHCLHDPRAARLGRRELGAEAREHGAVRLEEGAPARGRLLARRLHQRVLRQTILRGVATVL